MKKKWTSLLAIFFAVILCLSCFGLTAFATETQTQYGLEATIVTDKENYKANEDIHVTVTVKNTNDFKVKDVSIESLLPETLKLRDGDKSTKTVDLESGETLTLSFTAIKAEKEMTDVTNRGGEAIQTESPSRDASSLTTITADQATTTLAGAVQEASGNSQTNAVSLPQTGESVRNIVIVIVLLFACITIVALCLIKFKKKTTRVISLVMCVAISASAITGVTFFTARSANDNRQSVTVEKIITVDGKNDTIQSSIFYSKDETEDHNKPSEGFSAEELKIRNHFSETITSIIDSDKMTGNIDLDMKTASNSYDRIIQFIEEEIEAGHVKKYTVNESGICVEFTDGGIYLILFEQLLSRVNEVEELTLDKKMLSVSNMSTKNARYNIATLQPIASQVKTNNLDEAARKIEKSDLNYHFSTNLDDKMVDIDSLKTLQNNKIIMIHSHGGIVNGSYAFMTGEQVTDALRQKYHEDMTANKPRIVECDGLFIVTTEFFDFYYSDNSFNDTLLYLATCHSADDPKLYSVFHKKGINTILSYTRSVDNTYNLSMLKTVYEQLLKKDNNGSLQTVQQAVKKAKDVHGETDIDWWFREFGWWVRETVENAINHFNGNTDNINDKQPSQLIIQGNADFRLDSHMEYNQYGNTCSNILNGGTVVSDGTYHYFSLDNAICKREINSSSYTVIYNQGGRYLNLLDDRIYFVNDDNHICSMDKNGGNLIIWNDQANSLMIYNKEIYFSQGESGIIIRKDKDGNEIMKYKINSGCFVLYKDYIYYTKLTKYEEHFGEYTEAGWDYTGELCRIKIDGIKNQEIISQTINESFSIEGDHLYYKGSVKSVSGAYYPAFFKAKLDGSEQSVILNHSAETRELWSNPFHISDGRIYYIENYKDFCSCNLEGKDRTLISSDSNKVSGGNRICIANNWIYGYNESLHKSYLMKIDGSEYKELTNP